MRTPVRASAQALAGTTVAAAQPPLLLINGIGASLELLQPFVDALDPAIEVIRFDVPGVGGSPLPARPYRFSGLCAMIAGLLTELGHETADVLGISWGGGVAQQFAAVQRARCRRLVLVSTATGALMVPGRPAVLARMITPRRYTDPGYLEQIAGDLYGGSARTDPARVASAMHAGNRAGPGPRLPVPACGRDGLDQRAVPAAAAAADADRVRRRRPDHPAGECPDHAPPDPGRAAARLQRRSPGPGHRGGRAGAGHQRLPGRARQPARAGAGHDRQAGETVLRGAHDVAICG